MKRNQLLILLVLVLAGISAWLYWKNTRTSTLDDLAVEYTFKVEDTAAVTRIILRDKTPSRTELTREGNVWMVNGETPARMDAIQVLLETIGRMELRNFVPEKTKPEIMRRMGTYGVEVQVFQGEDEVRHFYVGTETQDQLGTYMLNHGASSPYAVHLPGFNGYLSTRFFARPELWMSRLIFGWQPEEIGSIEMTYADSASGFVLTKQGEGWRLTSGEGEELRLDPLKAQYYAALFKTLNYEGPITPADPIYSRKDSLLALPPVFELRITASNGEQRTLSGYRIKPKEGDVDDQGNPRAYDPDRLHGFIDGRRMVLLQFYGLEQVLRGRGWFLP